jgi:alpha-tubulin suppressor-like RCC1 family protein
MIRPARTWLAGTLLLAAACTDTRTPLAPENPAPALPPVLQAVECTLDLAQAGMRCGDAQPSTGGALGSGGVIVGGQNRYVRLASANVSSSGDTMRVDVTVQNLIDQPLGTVDGATADAGGVRVFFSDGPTAHPVGTAWVANADGRGIFLGPDQPFFRYDTLLGPGETSAPRTWKFAFSPGVSRITFTVYVTAQVQHDDERLVITPREKYLLPGDSVQLTAAVRDFTGGTRPRRVTWRTYESDVVSVDSTGLVRALKAGSAVVHADAESGLSDGVPIIVVTRDMAVRVEVTPDSVTLEMNETAQLSARFYNLLDEPVDGPVQWGDGDIWVATVNWWTGEIRATHPGQTRIHVGRDWADTFVVVTTLPGPEVAWRSVSTAQGHTCGVSTVGKAYCWGHNGAGQLGFGRTTGYGEVIPVGVAGGIAFKEIDGGNWFTCGLSTGGQAWCWGDGYFGQRGDGQEGYTDGVPRPQAVLGGHTFRTLSAGFEHACGLDVDGKAWCWGNNTYGQLGNDERVVVMGEPVPVEVVGGLTFRQISAGRDATCAITPQNELYCWGDNEIGQFGDGAGAPGLMIPRPTRGGVGHLWMDVALGDSHVCGLTVKGEAYCWGTDEFGELGTGFAEESTDEPARVVSDERFVDIGVGTYHSCAIADDGTAWCWGFDRWGQLGRGEKESIAPHPVPEPVIGGVRFAGSIQGGYRHTCAIGADDKAYCWGTDFHGEGGIQPNTEYCRIPGGLGACHTQPRAVSNPARGGIRTGPTAPSTPVEDARAAAAPGVASPQMLPPRRMPPRSTGRAREP